MNIIITGGTKGIGRAIAHTFARQGFNLALCARTLKDLKAFKKELEAEFPNIEVLIKKTDMSKKADVVAFAKYVIKTWKKIDILVNNAGVFLSGEILKEKSGLLEKQINTNLYSAYHMSRAIAPVMVKQKSGYIFNMCSIASKIVLPQCSSYCISKFALYGFSKALRDELKDKGVKVTSILPGATWSNAWTGADFPEDRLMNPLDVGEAIWSAFNMSSATVVEEILLRPQLGDL